MSATVTLDAPHGEQLAQQLRTASFQGQWFQDDRL
jgi:hypothetical protein